MPRLVWFGANASNLVEEWLADAPHQWVLKPNFGSGAFHFGTGTPKQDEAQALMDHWSDQHREDSGEWAYGQVRRIFLVEERLSPGNPLQDYKFYVFMGRIAVMYVTEAAHKGANMRFYCSAWGPLDATYGGRDLAPTLSPPSGLESMLIAASKLGELFDFMRVDLYFVAGQVRFGELTPYPGGGLRRIDPPSFDLWLGQQWDLPSLA